MRSRWRHWLRRSFSDNPAPQGPPGTSVGICRALPDHGHLRAGDPLPVYRRFRDRGRLAPEALRYVSSWVTQDLRRCFQVMETEDPELLTQWMANWQDVVEFE